MKVLAVILAMLTTSAFAQPTIYGTYAEPEYAELGKFPFKKVALTATEQAELGLTAKKLTAPVKVLNYFSAPRRDGKGRFTLETLPAGTVVLIDKDNMMRYKADCGNRIVEPKGLALLEGIWTVTPTAASGSASDNKTGPSDDGKGLPLVTAVNPTGPGFWKRLNNFMTSMKDGVWDILGWLLPLLAGIVILALIFYALRELYRHFTAQQQPNTDTTPRPVVTPTSPGATTPPAPTPVATQAPESADPYSFNVQMEDGKRPFSITLGETISGAVVQRNADGSTTIKVFPKQQ